MSQEEERVETKGSRNRQKPIDSLMSYLGPKNNNILYTQNILHTNKNILHIDKSQAM